MTRQMVRVVINILTTLNMWDGGRMISRMVKALRSGLMGHGMMVYFGINH